MRITQTDIAKKLNLSRVTVSKALNGSERVSDEVRRLVFNEAERMGYFKSPSGVGKLKTETQMRDIVFLGKNDFVGNQFWLKVIIGAERALKEANACMRMLFVPYDEAISFEHIDQIVRKKPDGIIFTGRSPENDYKFIASLKIPFVCYDYAYIGDANSTLDNCFDFDLISLKDSYGTYRLTEQLIVKGYKNIAFVGNYRLAQSFKMRYEGFLRAMRRYSLKPLEYDCHADEALPDNDSFASIEDFLRSKDMPVAFVCENDVFAKKVLQQLKQYPDLDPGIVVCGFDNMLEKQDRFFGTVESFGEGIGFALAERIIRRIENPDEPYTTTFLNVKPIVF